MDCCICSPMASLYRPPRNTICPSCYEGAKCMIRFINELEIDRDVANPTKFHGLKPQASKVSCSFFYSPSTFFTFELMKGPFFNPT